MDEQPSKMDSMASVAGDGASVVELELEPEQEDELDDVEGERTLDVSSDLVAISHDDDDGAPSAKGSLVTRLFCNRNDAGAGRLRGESLERTRPRS